MPEETYCNRCGRKLRARVECERCFALHCSEECLEEHERRCRQVARTVWERYAPIVYVALAFIFVTMLLCALGLMERMGWF